ncbi:hypothetical protein MAR_019953 [Mya arenaria]|uniref:MULE transposase domain-containing protein n=1 Tax=Mya arenaria TaxID=6604 RepID=A0ABY7E614_MYAAR|nr:hypothetical protein MAR_019953 [Mya arenaria]
MGKAKSCKAQFPCGKCEKQRNTGCLFSRPTSPDNCLRQWSVKIRENPQSFLVYHFCTGNLVVGSDDEQALSKSIQRSFPGATHIQCTRHLKNNVKDYLCHKIGVRDDEKNKIIQSLFGEYGLADSDSTVIFDHRFETVHNLVSEQAAGFLPYLNGRIVPLIKNHVHIPKRVRNWTNNNTESMNNLLKIGTNHKVENMTDLIDIIYRIVQSMYKDVEKSIVSMGNYKLTQPYEHHKMSVDAWCQKTEQGRNGILA